MSLIDSDAMAGKTRLERMEQITRMLHYLGKAWRARPNLRLEMLLDLTTHDYHYNHDDQVEERLRALATEAP